MNYAKAAELLDSARNRSAGKPLCRNTRIYARGDDYAVTLHGTDVITLHPDGSFTLDSGGWRTVTTKDRINAYAPFEVGAGLWQKDGFWFVTTGQNKPIYPARSDYGTPEYESAMEAYYKADKAWRESNTVPYADGMTIHPDNSVTGTMSAADWSKYVAKVKATKKTIGNYVTRFLNAMERGEVPMPSSGDCWGCCMTTADGETVFGDDHLEQHMSENYYVPSLMVNAMREKGYQDAGIYMLTGMNPDANQMGTRRMEKDSCRHALRGYMQKHLLPDYAGR